MLSMYVKHFDYWGGSSVVCNKWFQYGVRVEPDGGVFTSDDESVFEVQELTNAPIG